MQKKYLSNFAFLCVVYFHLKYAKNQINQSENVNLNFK